MTGVMVPLDVVIVVVGLVLVVMLAQREVLEIGCGTLLVLVLITAVLLVMISRGRESEAVGSGPYGTMSALDGSV